ncbi:adhesion protein [Clostridia bacterium]|nr:adhesion protein [Clostridia bacterium]
MKTRLFSGVVAILIATCMLGGCVPKSAAVRQPDKFKIVASFYPLYIIAKNVVGDAPNVELVNMTSALGDCLHDYALLPSDLIKLEDANVLLINEENNWNVPEGVATVDVGGEEHEWLSFDGAITYAHVIADELGKIDSNNRAIYNENANLFIEKIRERRAIMSSQIANVSNKNVVVAHEGFEFIMRDLGLNVVAITQVEHDAEMTPTDIDNTIRAMKETGVRVIFVPVEDEIAAGITTIAREMGDEIKVVGLSSLVSGEVEKDAYFKQIDENFAKILAALR